LIIIRYSYVEPHSDISRFDCRYQTLYQPADNKMFKPKLRRQN